MFAGCTSLTTVTGMSGVSSIPNYMFTDCTNLTTVDISLSNLPNIGNYAFNNCTSLQLTITDSTLSFTDTGRSAFQNTRITFPQNLTISTINNNLSLTNKDVLRAAFYGTTLYNVTLDSSIKTVSANAFENSHMKSIDA